MAKTPVGAGDLGQVLQCLRDAAAAVRGGDWKTALLHVWHVIEEAKKAMDNVPQPMMAANPAECEQAAKDLELCAARAAADGATAIPWAMLLSTLLPLLLKLFQK